MANSAELTAELPGRFRCEVTLGVTEGFRISLETVGFVGSCMMHKRVLAAISAKEFLLQVIVLEYRLFFEWREQNSSQLVRGGEGCFLGLMVTYTGLMLLFFLCLKWQL